MNYGFGDIYSNPDRLPENIAQSSQGIRPVFTPWAGFKAAFQAPNLTETIYDKVVFNSLGDSGKTLSPTEIKNQFGIDEEEPLTRDQVEMILNKREAESNRNFILSNIDPYATGNIAAPLTGGLLGGLSDPAALGTGLFLESMAVKGMAALANAGRVSRQLSVGQRIAFGGGIGLAEGVIEDQVFRSAADQFGTEYTTADSLINIGLSTIAGGLFEGIARGKDFISEADSAAKRSATTISQGKKPRDIDGPVRDSAIDIQRRSEPEVAREEGTFFSANRTDNDVINADTQANFGTGRFGGQSFVSSRNLAGARVSNGLDGANGKVVTVDVDTNKIVEIDSALPDGLEDSVKAKVDSEFSSEVAEAFNGKSTIKEVMEAVDRLKTSEGRDIIQDSLNSALVEKGIDGVRYRAIDSQGGDLGAEALTVFNKNSVKARGVESTEPTAPLTEDVVNSGREAHANYLESKESNLLSDPLADAEVDQLSPEVQKSGLGRDIEETKTRLSEIRQDIVEGSEQATQMETALKENLPDKMRTIAKAMFDCVRRS